jgi:pyridoxamine 5'-phosphate oxidase
MKITLRYFASVREQLAQSQEQVDTSATTLNDLRQELIARFEAYDAQFPESVPRPPHWGGYALNAHYLDFWQGQPSRLHERRAYVRHQNQWQSKLLNP